MVNQVVFEYLKVNRGNYKLEDLKKKILASGYSQQDINEAMIELNKVGGSAPSVPATISQINRTNIDMNANKPVVQSVQPVVQTGVQESKKKGKGLKWLIVILVFLIILGGIGFGIWYWLGRGVS